jgi:hypothetical protein
LFFFGAFGLHAANAGGLQAAGAFGLFFAILIF